ncbi:MAG: AAA family ATPase [Phormidesmis sp.]
MIPQQLKLQNFLSYREVVLDFGGLHVACVCGPNGAGKSSLLEAIAWCVWGQSRVSAEDDIVRQGAIEAQVSFCFRYNGQTYRIIRTRRRRQMSALEFQIQTAKVAVGEPGGYAFKSLTQKGVRATQQYILQQLKIDYETFVNAAYLRQGRADEFMLKRPSERKQVLADLLKLDRYDQLAEQAKEQARAYKAEIPLLELLLEQLSTKIESRCGIQQQYAQLNAKISAEENSQKEQRDQLKKMKQQQQKRLSVVQQLALARQEQQHQRSALELSQVTMHDLQQQLDDVEKILAQAANIQANYQEIAQLREQEDKQANQFQRYQQAQAERLDLQQQLTQQTRQQQLQLTQLEIQLAQLTQQEEAVLQTLKKKESIAEKIEALGQAKQQLRWLDKTEAETAPLRQRFSQIQGQIEQAHTRLITQIELLDSQQTEIIAQQSQSPQLIQAVAEVAHRIAHLEKRRAYQEAVRQKGIERRSFMEGLQSTQLNCEVTLSQLEQRLQLLEDPDEAHCPLCEQALVGEPWAMLRDRTATERDDVQNQIWAIREQLAVSDSEIQVLRQEYRALEEELAKYVPILEERAELKAKLVSVDALQDRLRAMTTERAQLEQCLQENDYAQSLQAELRQLETQLAAVQYDERDHALVRSQVDRLRWSEIKQAEIKAAEKQLAQIRQQRPQLVSSIRAVQAELAAAEKSEAAQQLQVIEARLSELDYSLADHNQLRERLRAAREWETRYQQLQQAQVQKSALSEKINCLQKTLKEQDLALQAVTLRVEQLETQHLVQADCSEEIVELEQSLSKSLACRDPQLAQSGRLQQQLLQLDNVEQQQKEKQKKLENIRLKYQVYRSLSEAFGRNGIQALMIENLLPQLEAMTNQVLGRLSDHQLHVQFVTQRAGRGTGRGTGRGAGRGAGRQKSQRQTRLIDTLDILIAAARGTRPYETYSGGEAYRVNFAIRLAIARLLAMRSGTALQMLIVDEGVGTQDREGCDRLIAAIEAIAPDFACILTITHMPHFREAFQTRIDVSKDEEGSHITISA